VPEVNVTHESLSGSDATTAPKREPVPPGLYKALIMSCPLGTTRGTPPLQKISAEFQLLHQVMEDEKIDDSVSGRRVYQDFILEKDPSYPSLDSTRRYELRMLLDATGTPFTDKGFNTDHVVNKTVMITVRHRTGRQPDEHGNLPVFSNVVKIDTAEKVNEEDLV
jgi:hypothetical protein